jgi:hypothetical protein
MTAPSSSKPTLAGVFNLASGAMGLIGGGILLLLGLVGSGVLWQTVHGPEAPLAIVPIAFFGPMALLLLVSGAVAVWGGMAALHRRNWPRVVLGGIAATICFLPLGVVALIVSVMAEGEFSST